MNSPVKGTVSSAMPNLMPNSFEDTLRSIARLPEPAGLAERVQSRLDAAPRRGRVLAWPAALRPGGTWMRAAAAAAIVVVVVGGGWSVYSRVQPGSQARVMAMPQHVSAPGGFSNAGAMRTPQTLNGPVVTHAATVGAASSDLAAKVPAPKPLSHGKGGLVSKATAQPVESAAK